MRSEKNKNNFFSKRNIIIIVSVLVLLIGGVIGKAVGFILRIIITRYLGTEGMGLYSLLSPTASLLTVIATFSYPTSISKVISERSATPKSVILSLIPLSLLMSLFETSCVPLALKIPFNIPQKSHIAPKSRTDQMRI